MVGLDDDAQIPGPFAEKTAGGAPNPLYDSETLLTAADIREGAPLVERTSREPGQPDWLPSPADLADVFSQSNYAFFNDACENIHDGCTAGSAGRWATSATPRSNRSSGRTTA